MTLNKDLESANDRNLEVTSATRVNTDSYANYTVSNFTPSISVDEKARLHNEEAFEKFLELVYDAGDTVWAKSGHHIFYRTEYDGQTLVDAGVRNKKAGIIPVNLEDGDTFYDYLSAKCSNEEKAGAFYIPGQPNRNAGFGSFKEYCLESNDIGAELDAGTPEEQLARINLVAEATGLKPNFIISSGGKSLHPHWILDEKIDIDTRTFLSKMFCILLESDPAVTRPAQPMRIPGFDRQEKDSHQWLVVLEEERYSLEDVSAGLEEAFEVLNYTWIESEDFSDRKWALIQRHLTKSTNREGLGDRIREALAKPEEELRPKSETKPRTYTGFTGSGNLLEHVKRFEQSQNESWFDWSGHNWQHQGGKLKGYCPWHESKSGTAAWLSEGNDGGTQFHCPSCTDNKPTGALKYRWALETGNHISDDFSGKEWAEFAKKETGYVETEEDKQAFREWDKANLAPKSEEELKKEYFEKWEQQRKLKSIPQLNREPNTVITEGYFKLPSLGNLPSKLIALKGKYGKGKSTAIANLTKEIHGGVMQIGHLNSLLANTAKQFGTYFHKDLKTDAVAQHCGGMLGGLGEKLAITDVSLALHLDAGEWISKNPFYILLLDEIEQVLKSMQLSNTLAGSDKEKKQLRLLARRKLELLIRHASFIIAADSDLSSLSLEYVEAVRGTGEKFHIYQHTGKKGEGRVIKINTNWHIDAVLTEVIEDIKSGKKLCLCFESKSDLLTFELMLQKAGISDKKILTLHSDNSNEKEIKELITNIDKAYLNYDILAYTMTLGTGVSLETEHFDKVYAFYTGDVLTAQGQLQALFRYRPVCDITIWCRDKKKTLQISEDHLLLDLVTKRDASTELIARSIDSEAELIEQGILVNDLGGITEGSMPWYKHKLAVIAQSNASQANPLQTLKDILEESGFTLEIENTDEEKAKKRTEEGYEFKEVKKEVKDSGDRAQASSRDLTDAEEQKLKEQKGNLTKEDRDALAKKYLKDFTHLEVTPELVKLERTTKFTKCVKLLQMLLTGLEDAIAHDAEERLRVQDENDRSHYGLKVRLLEELGVKSLIVSLINGDMYRWTDELPSAIATNARKEKAKIKRLFGLTINTELLPKEGGWTEEEKITGEAYKLSNGSVLGSLLSLVSIKTEIKKKTKFRVYGLDTKHFDLVNAVYKHYEPLKLADFYLPAALPPALPQANPETLAESTLEAAALPPSNNLFSYKNMNGVPLELNKDLIAKIGGLDLTDADDHYLISLAEEFGVTVGEIKAAIATQEKERSATLGQIQSLFGKPQACAPA